MNKGDFFPGKIKQVKYVEGRILFPISWLQKQDYCEYQIYLENVVGIKVAPTAAMTKGSDVHEKLFQKFAEHAEPATLEQMVIESKTAQLLSRELRVEDANHGIFGFIDEVWLTPDAFVVIDDKPGITAYTGNIHQVYGYCLALREDLELDNRPLVAALRQRGTQNIFWQAPFTGNVMDEVTALIMHVHDLLNGRVEFRNSGSANKCRSCRLKVRCDRHIE